MRLLMMLGACTLVLVAGIFIGAALQSGQGGLDLIPLPVADTMVVRQQPLSTYEAADVALNARTTSATEETLYWSRISAVVGALGAVLLVITLIFTAQATKASTDNAKAALSAIELEKDSADRTLRPYVFLEFLNWNRHISADVPEIIDSITFLVRWKNYGSTPADDITTNTNMMFFDEYPGSEYDYPNHPVTNYAAPLPQGGSFESRFNIKVSELEKEFSAGKKLIIWAWIEYESRPGRPRHRTEGCMQITYAGKLNSKESVFVFTHHRYFNGADRYCFRQPLRNAPASRFSRFGAEISHAYYGQATSNGASPKERA